MRSQGNLPNGDAKSQREVFTPLEGSYTREAAWLKQEFCFLKFSCAKSANHGEQLIATNIHTQSTLLDFFPCQVSYNDGESGKRNWRKSDSCANKTWDSVRCSASLNFSLCFWKSAIILQTNWPRFLRDVRENGVDQRVMGPPSTQEKATGLCGRQWWIQATWKCIHQIPQPHPYLWKMYVIYGVFKLDKWPNLFRIRNRKHIF